MLITTSREPSSRLVQFAKELKLCIPNSQRVNRGGLVVQELVETSRGHDFTDIGVCRKATPGDRKPVSFHVKLAT